MNERQSSLEEITASGCTFISGYILLALALFANRPVLLIPGVIILFVSLFLARKLAPENIKGCASSGIVMLLWLSFIIARLFWAANMTTKLFVILFSPTGLILLEILGLSGTEASKGIAYFKKSHKEIKDLHSKENSSMPSNKVID
jgi:hypothetical protein